MRAYRGEVKALSDLLGDDDDLEVMHAILVERPAPLGVACQFNGVLNLIECCQAQLKAEAQMLGRPLFTAEEPGCFTHRFGGYWRAWQEDAESRRAAEGSIHCADQ